MDATLHAAAVAVLATADPAGKARRSRAAAALWRDGRLARDPDDAAIPDRPARPDRPVLLAPGEMPRRRAGRSPAHRIALFHALAHIELNAIDLAWDMVARFAPAMPSAFAGDWIAVADEEAHHFLLLAGRLAALGAAYGDLPAHDGLWQAAAATAHDLPARLAVVPLVLEARGLDVTPAMIVRLRAWDDDAGAEVLETIYRDEIGHVATGMRWFRAVCADRGLDPVSTWRALVRRHFHGRLKPPFNEDARRAAGITPDYYAGLAGC